MAGAEEMGYDGVGMSEARTVKNIWPAQEKIRGQGLGTAPTESTGKAAI